MSKKSVELEPAFVLHTWPYRETSLIVECFSRMHGRIAVVARGAKRATSDFRGILQAMRPLLLTWRGEKDLKTLYHAELEGPYRMPVGTAWLCGCYLNELVLKLLARYDPHTALFDCYREAMISLAEQTPETQPVFFEVLLRGFEKSLLRHIGYDIPLSCDIETGQEVSSEQQYRFKIGHGPVAARIDNDYLGPIFSGQALVDIDQDRYDSAQTRVEAKALMRLLINHQLGGETLRTRKMLQDLQNLSVCL